MYFLLATWLFSAIFWVISVVVWETTRKDWAFEAMDALGITTILIGSVLVMYTVITK